MSKLEFIKAEPERWLTMPTGLMSGIILWMLRRRGLYVRYLRKGHPASCRYIFQVRLLPNSHTIAYGTSERRGSEAMFIALRELFRR